MERIYGNFSRDFPVPASLDSSRIKATLKSGILRVVAPKTERAQPIAVERKSR
jgi:HSP20 family protein